MTLSNSAKKIADTIARKSFYHYHHSKIMSASKEDKAMKISAKFKSIAFTLLLWIANIALLTFSILFVVYRFEHPEKTETQLSIDLFNGEICHYFFESTEETYEETCV